MIEAVCRTTSVANQLDFRACMYAVQGGTKYTASFVKLTKLIIRESVNSLCRDGADAQYMQYLKQKPYNFTTNTLKAYLSA